LKNNQDRIDSYEALDRIESHQRATKTKKKWSMNANQARLRWSDWEHKHYVGVTLGAYQTEPA